MRLTEQFVDDAFKGGYDPKEAYENRPPDYSIFLNPKVYGSRGEGEGVGRTPGLSFL